ncbi:long-subunit acyl-CoA synthetase (AMP-forming) [Pseudomonas sp. SJZ079]|uniref:AMP-binding protein n=1 Tax=Pseudomonas sp. SJZ079 TaxID=2572887 RepID=UPI0011999F66|nr:AMP-binding protein [Pseudomonas sp. SJZ079]TWC31391.1 long-subunit acyl-CoA synthetase (AMP-forming) [Pseudomonas sp. SJZ079]
MWPAAEALFHHLSQQGERIALSDGSRQLSYRQLLDDLQQRSEQLRRSGVQRVALALDNGIDWVLWDLAALKAGLVCVPLPGFFSAAQQQHVLDSAGVDCLIGANLAEYRDLGFAEMAGGLLQRPLDRPAVLPVGTCKITYTSGTTGQPKGVCLDAQTQLRVADSLYRASASCRIEHHLCVLPLATLLENIAGVYAPLLAGARIELRPMAQIGLQGASQFDLPRFLDTLNSVQPHSLILLPQLLLALVSAAEQGLPLPASLRFIAVGGGRVAPQLLRRSEALGLPVFEGYGLSECASVVCLNTPQQRRIGTVGLPLAHLELRLGADQEVQVRGPRMLGYLGEPAPEGEWLGTGDLGHFVDGFLILHGRKKHQFVTAFGRNVNPEWVEAELVQQLPIAQAWLHGEALPANVAVLVPRFARISDRQLAEAVDQVNQTLPDYAQVHHWLRAEQPFSAANQLATANGRLRRAALYERYQAAIDALMVDESSYGDA